MYNIYKSVFKNGENIIKIKTAYRLSLFEIEKMKSTLSEQNRVITDDITYSSVSENNTITKKQIAKRILTVDKTSGTYSKEHYDVNGKTITKDEYNEITLANINELSNVSNVMYGVNNTEDGYTYFYNNGAGKYDFRYSPSNEKFYIYVDFDTYEEVDSSVFETEFKQTLVNLYEMNWD